MDSHKDTLAVSGVDAAGRQQQTQVFPNTRQGHRRLVAWLQAQAGVVRVGIEGAGGYGRAVAMRLVQAGLVVVEVTPSLTVRERRRLRQRGKADPTDALAIARVTAREQDLPPVRRQDLAEDLRLLVDYREQLLGERTRIANRVHADLVALQPGYQQRLPELRPGEELADGPPIHGNTRLEIIWTAIPAVLLVALCFAYFHPVFVGQLIPYDAWQSRMWLGSRWI